MPLNKENNRLIAFLRKFGVRFLSLALASILVAVGIAAFIAVRFYETEKKTLLQHGELNAKESTIEYDRHLLTRVNIVTLVGYIADDMLAAGKDAREIEKMIVDETNYVSASLDPSTTGLYGWVNGEYIDGAGWTPDEGFVPTERPWYIQALASDQKITFVEPYLDLKTNTVMMTVATRLSDGQSVLAMDVSLDPIQEIVEKVASLTPGGQAFLLDEGGVVVVHSQEDQLGRNYLEEPDSLGGSVARRLLVDGETQFDLRTAEGNYSVYVEKLVGGWYSVSLINADIWYSPLRRTVIVSFTILALTVLFLAALFLRLNNQNLALQRLHTRITQEEKRGKELQILSETDRMTGLYDRVSAKARIDDLLCAGGGMFLELDVDNFKNINDTYGHQAGDRVILAVADALHGVFRTNDVVFRLGGDEFGVFATGIVDRALGETIVRRLFDRIERVDIPELGGKKIHISVGAALSFEGASSFDELYALADSVLYVSKKTSGNSLTFSA
ncbi:MAG: diguanylate cyclase [Clostridia bacterium]|nr:diguanylate cyclase [Clostridia bacterium]